MVTSLLASFLTFLYLKITFEVIKNRRSQKVSLGSGENDEILKFTSAHSNFSAYVPLMLILFYLIESSNLISNMVLIPLALVIFIGRLLHYKGLTAKEMNFPLRVRGMKLTIFPMIVMSLLLIAINIYKNI